MLTKKQHQLLVFIRERMTADGIAPSFDEMKEALKLKSKSGIHRLITALEERGFLRRLPHRARALEVVKLPDNATDRLPDRGVDRPSRERPDRTGFNVITGNFSSALPSRMSTTNAALRILAAFLTSSANFGIRSMGRLSTA